MTAPVDGETVVDSPVPDAAPLLPVNSGAPKEMLKHIPAADIDMHTDVDPDVPAPSAIQGTLDQPRDALEEEAENGLGKRTRRMAGKLLNLGGCDNCGKVYSEAEKVYKSVVTECSKKDCETRWFHVPCMDEGVLPKNSICETCRGGKRGPKRRRRA
ncbi:hypothetical protein B0H14DRAFT_2579185 [Mycena olivaceomarginata]|nr:hypothetical protein B0H14DRAFT_2579185 [Mycena olivaceomarginata]